MNTHADKTQENKSQSVANMVSQMQSSDESSLQVVDNRPEAVAQRKLQEMANNSPQVSQLRSFQAMANNSPGAKKAAQLQAAADNNSFQQQPIQKKENNTGLPDDLKSGIENHSGNTKPLQLQADLEAIERELRKLNEEKDSAERIRAESKKNNEDYLEKEKKVSDAYKPKNSIEKDLKKKQRELAALQAQVDANSQLQTPDVSEEDKASGKQSLERQMENATPGRQTHSNNMKDVARRGKNDDKHTIQVGNPGGISHAVRDSHLHYTGKVAAEAISRSAAGSHAAENQSAQSENRRLQDEIQPLRREVAQLKVGTNEQLVQNQGQKNENNTGLPDNLKSGIENLSGYSMDDVKVNYNSGKPAQLQAHAYAQGTDIHLASGQEKHLPHEAWHVVQQKQGRVQPTMQMKQGTPVNDDAGLEHEADVMGEKALQMRSFSLNSSPIASAHTNNTVAQLVVNWAGLAERTAGDNYGLSANHSILYSKPGAAAPEPRAMYAQGVEATNDEVPVALSAWKSNVKLLTGAAIDHGHVPTAEERAGWDDESIDRPDDGAILAELRPEYERIKAEVTAAMAEAAEGGASPTMGIVGRNDCAQWANALQGLIHQTREAVAPAVKADFDLGRAAAPAMHGAPAVGVGDKMEQQLGGGADSGHHGATVVARDGASLVTLEAHVEKNLTAPEFHIHAGLSGFVDSNNAGADGAANTYLEANGRSGSVTPLGAAPLNIASRTAMLEHYSGELANADTGRKLDGIQGLLKYYEAVVPAVEAEVAADAGAKPKGKCFLTTACVTYHNLPDDCEELTVLRDFRDNYMRKLPEGKSLIQKYYEVAPKIVAMIDSTANRRDIYEDLYVILRTCVEAIKEGNNSLALQVYKDMVIKLHHENLVKK